MLSEVLTVVHKDMKKEYNNTLSIYEDFKLKNDEMSRLITLNLIKFRHLTVSNDPYDMQCAYNKANIYSSEIFKYMFTIIQNNIYLNNEIMK